MCVVLLLFGLFHNGYVTSTCSLSFWGGVKTLKHTIHVLQLSNCATYVYHNIMQAVTGSKRSSTSKGSDDSSVRKFDSKKDHIKARHISGRSLKEHSRSHGKYNFLQGYM